MYNLVDFALLVELSERYGKYSGYQSAALADETTYTQYDQRHSFCLAVAVGVVDVLDLPNGCLGLLQFYQL